MIFSSIFQTKEEKNSMHNKTLDCILKILKKLKSNDKDFSDIHFLPPVGYILIKTYAEQNNIDIKTFIFSNDVKSFLNNLNFFSNKNKTNVDYILPILSLSSRGDEENIGNCFMEILNKKILNNSNLINGVQKIIGECLNNIIDHSGSDDYMKDGLRVNYSSGQYFGKKEFLQIVIVDGGIGILSSLRKRFPKIEDGKIAIKRALEANISGGKILTRENIEYTQYSNRGIGLTTTLEIIKSLKGDLFIGSRDYLYSYCGKTGKENFTNISGMTWSGTFIVINIYSKDKIDVNINEIESKILGINNSSNEINNNIDFG